MTHPTSPATPFLDDDSHRFYPDWDTAADTCVAILRTEAGRDPHDKALHDLVGELSTRSGEFRRRWGRKIRSSAATSVRLDLTCDPQRARAMADEHKASLKAHVALCRLRLLTKLREIRC